MAMADMRQLIEAAREREKWELEKQLKRSDPTETECRFCHKTWINPSGQLDPGGGGGRVWKKAYYIPAAQGRAHDLCWERHLERIR